MRVTTSLKAKLVAATLASITTIAALVFAVDYGASTFSGIVVQSRVITTAVRNHANADMMHDALRADVFAALQFARGAPERRGEIAAETSAHAAEMQRLIANNRTLPLPPDVIARLADLEQLLALYSASAELLVAAAFADPQTAALQLSEFERQFFVLEAEMEIQGDVLEASAAAQTATATAF